MDIDDFSGCKLALLYKEKLLVYKRDNKADIPFPGCFDLPGGGREGEETPEQCVLRELAEEFGLHLGQGRLTYRRRYISADEQSSSYFFAAAIQEEELSSISFGNEGTSWKLLNVDDYLTHSLGIADLQNRLKDYLVWKKGD